MIPVDDDGVLRHSREDALDGLVIPERDVSADVEPCGIAGKPGLRKHDERRAAARRFLRERTGALDPGWEIGGNFGLDDRDADVSGHGPQDTTRLGKCARGDRVSNRTARCYSRGEMKKLNDRPARALRAFNGAGGARTLGACLLALLASQPVKAQDSTLVNPGEHIRYWLPEISRPVEAEVVSWSTDRIRVRPIETGDTLEFALSALSRLDVRRGPEPQGEGGAALGLFGGAIIGSFHFERGGRSSGTYQGDVLRAYLFAVVCAGVGWLIGSRVHRYHWQTVLLVPDA